MWDYLVRGLGFIINFIYKLVQNYGLAIILFTVVVRLLLLPLNIRSQRAMRKQQKIQPILAELQKKYANDKEKLQTEMMKLYRENNVSMTGGCLPLLIQMPILVALYQVIQKPLTYIMNVNWSAVTDKVQMLIDRTGSSLAVADLTGSRQIELASMANSNPGIADEWAINFNFMGLDLSKNPMEGISRLFRGDFSNLSIVLLVIIPILAVFTSWLSMKVTQIKQKNDTENPMAATTGTMNLLMPLMTGFFTISLPSGIGLYWTTGSICQILQHITLNKYLEKEEEGQDVKLPEPNRKNKKKRKK